jgi:hypothetical protein
MGAAPADPELEPEYFDFGTVPEQRLGPMLRRSIALTEEHETRQCQILPRQEFEALSRSALPLKSL